MIPTQTEYTFVIVFRLRQAIFKIDISSILSRGMSYSIRGACMQCRSQSQNILYKRALQQIPASQSRLTPHDDDSEVGSQG
jgi:hypothetical protein